VLFGKVLEFSITLTLGISPESAPCSVSRVLRGRCQSKSESIFKVLSFVHCVPMITTSSMFIGFECMCNAWKVEKVN
jgi:hypothetical protein